MKCGVGNDAQTEPGKGSIYFIVLRVERIKTA